MAGAIHFVSPGSLEKDPAQYACEKRKHFYTIYFHHINAPGRG
ncbi:MAG: hypothetical protein JWP44_2884 [Mucilaginibacter sp.]|nr:hypothetical protein [Mucilaginibacter sp.]